ncbi:hypothetical protein [Sodalis ligni]|uniref:hypothetical protein n=1 Tax=Sodalis ligni TaxID=2697027 RepID=UPI00104E0F08|nr:hypothetical protein [Sodalis ligni]
MEIQRLLGKIPRSHLDSFVKDRDKANVLAPHQLLRGRRYVCIGTLSDAVTEGVYVDAPMVEDENLLSGRGVGAAFDSAFYLAVRLTGDERGYAAIR